MHNALDMDLPQVIEKWEEFSITTTKNINKNTQEKNRTVELTAITFQLCETDQTSTHLPRIFVTFPLDSSRVLTNEEQSCRMKSDLRNNEARHLWELYRACAARRNQV